jgi:hypothetical protein
MIDRPLTIFFKRNNNFIAEAEGGGRGGGRDCPAWLVSHCSVDLTAPPAAAGQLQGATWRKPGGG